IGGWSHAAARAVAREAARLFEEVDEGVHRIGQLAPAQMHDVPVAPNRKAANVELDQPAAGKLERRRVERDDGQAELGFDRALDGPVRSELHGHYQLGAGLASGLLE